MSDVLIINASPDADTCKPRAMTAEVERKRCAIGGAEVTRRDGGIAPPPHPDGPMIAAADTPPEVRTPEQGALLRLSDALIDEFLAADIIVVGAPLHNVGITSSLVTHVDHVVRVGPTFRLTELGAVGLVPPGWKMFVLDRPRQPVQRRADAVLRHAGERDQDGLRFRRRDG